MLPWAPPSNLGQADGRRERKRSQTRGELVSAAIKLFATQGYAQTTIEQITELADVSPRTFFRYFTSKEEVLFPTDDPPEYDEFVDAIVAQPPRSNDLTAIRDAYVALLPKDEESFRRILQLKAAIRSTPTLEGRDLILQRSFRDVIARGVARRHGLAEPDEHAVLVAALAQAVIHLAFDRWAEANGTVDLGLLLQRHFDHADGVVGAGNRRKPHTSPEVRRCSEGP